MQRRQDIHIDVDVTLHGEHAVGEAERAEQMVGVPHITCRPPPVSVPLEHCWIKHHHRVSQDAVEGVEYRDPSWGHVLVQDRQLRTCRRHQVARPLERANIRLPDTCIEKPRSSRIRAHSARSASLWNSTITRSVMPSAARAPIRHSTSNPSTSILRISMRGNAWATTSESSVTQSTVMRSSARYRSKSCKCSPAVRAIVF